MVIIYGISMMIFKDYLNDNINIPFTNYTIICLLAGIFLIGIYQIYNYWFIRKKNFLIISQSKVFKNLTMAVIQLVSGFIQPSFSSLISGDVLGRGIGYSVLFYKKKISRINVSINMILLLLRKYRKFPFYSGPAVLLNTLSIYATPLILISLYGPDIAGHYSFGQRMIGVPILIVGHSIAQVYYNEVSEIIHDKKPLYKLYKQAVIKLFLLAILPTLILFFFGSTIFKFIFGNNWVQSGRFIQIMIIPYLFRFIMTPVSQTLLILEKQNIQFYWDLSRVILIGLIFYFCKINAVDIYVAVGMYSFGMMTMYIGQYFVIRKYINSYESYINK